MEAPDDLDAPPVFGFRALCVICLAGVALVLQAMGAWIFVDDLQAPLWGPDELAPLVFVMPMVLALYSFPLAAIAAGLVLKRGTTRWLRVMAFGSVVAAILLAAATFVAPSIVLSRAS